jgi:hypothetical protein
MSEVIPTYVFYGAQVDMIDGSEAFTRVPILT